MSEVDWDTPPEKYQFFISSIDNDDANWHMIIN